MLISTFYEKNFDIRYILWKSFGIRYFIILLKSLDLSCFGTYSTTWAHVAFTFSKNFWHKLFLQFIQKSWHTLILHFIKKVLVYFVYTIYTKSFEIHLVTYFPSNYVSMCVFTHILFSKLCDYVCIYSHTFLQTINYANIYSHTFLQTI